jgi:hypothetical protein
MAEKRTWLVWWPEHREDGSYEVQATSREEAIRIGAEVLETNPSELDASEETEEMRVRGEALNAR